MIKILFPGTFDPFTKAHLNIVTRVLKLGYHIDIGILENSKKKTMFTKEKRKEMIEIIIEKYKLENVNVFFDNRLLVEICRDRDINYVVRGLRNVRDYEYETEMEYNNKKLNSKLEYIYINSELENMHISSSTVRELLNHNAPIDHLVPREINEFIRKGNNG